MRSHARLIKLGLDRNAITATKLLTSYLTPNTPSSLSDAHRLFNAVPAHARDTTLYTALISAYSRSPNPAPALRLLSLMLSSPFRPNAFTLASAARAASSSSPLHLHSLALKLALHSHVVVATALLCAYSRSNDLVSARSLFDEMPEKSTITWNSIISAYATAGFGAPALRLFHQMRCLEFDVTCDEFSVASGLTACAGVGDARSGAQIHAYVISAGLQSDTAVANATANMYFRCGDVESAERVIGGREEGDPMLQLMMVKGYVYNERYADAIRRVTRRFAQVVMVDCSVVVSILTACANIGLVRIGRQVHGLVITMGVTDNCDCPSVFECVLMDMYCKCSSVAEAQCVFDSLLERNTSHWNSMITGFVHNGMLEEAERLFDGMDDKNVVSWTAMISGYVQQGLPLKGLQLFARMYSDSGLVRGNSFTFATAINACSRLGGLDLGKQIHVQSLRTCSETGIDNVVVETALVDMYSKTGNLSYAEKVFARMQKKNVVSWTSMIDGYTSHGFALEAIEVFEQMTKVGCQPNAVTFLAILGACSHCGLVDKGIHYFNLMRDINVVPDGDHFACVVDMLGRAGRLVEAWNFVQAIKAQGRNVVNAHKASADSAALYGALLAGCRLHGDIEIACKIAEEMLKRKYQTSDTYVALSNVYAAAEMWEKVSDVREQWRKQAIAREPGLSQIHG